MLKHPLFFCFYVATSLLIEENPKKTEMDGVSVEMSFYGVQYIYILYWVWPPHSNSDQQDYYIFSRGSQPKPSFPTVAVRGPYPNYIYI